MRGVRLAVSAGRKPRLRPALRHFVQDQGYRFVGYIAVRFRTRRLRQNGPCLAGEPVPVSAAMPKGLQRREEGGPAQPDVGLPHPSVQDSISSTSTLCIQALHERTHNVNGQRIDECP